MRSKKDVGYNPAEYKKMPYPFIVDYKEVDGFLFGLIAGGFVSVYLGAIFFYFLIFVFAMLSFYIRTKARVNKQIVE